MLTVPHDLPPAAVPLSDFSILEPPHPASTIAPEAARAAARNPIIVIRTRILQFSSMTRPPLLGAGTPRCGLRDPVEEDAEQHYRETRGEPLAVKVALREARDHQVPESAGADQPADDDHGEHVDQALVRRQCDRAPGHRQLDLRD